MNADVYTEVSSKNHFPSLVSHQNAASCFGLKLALQATLLFWPQALGGYVA